MHGLKAAVLVVSACVTAALVSGCGGSQPETACVVVDASHSTRYALPDYLERFETGVLEVSEAGGTVAAVVATGKPLVESKVESEDFSDLTSSEDTGARNARAQEFLGDVEDGAREAAIGLAAPAAGSGIVAAISLVAGEGCGSILALSDGLEAADVRMMVDDIVSEPGRERLLDEIEDRGRLPELEGVALEFPFGGYLPQGIGSDIGAERMAAVVEFWRAYAARTGATLSWPG